MAAGVVVGNQGMAPPSLPGYQSGGLKQPPMAFSAAAGGWVYQPDPEGYKWDPVEGRYVRTAASKGSDVKAFGDAAMPDSIKGLMSNLSNFGSGGVPAANGGLPTTNGGFVSGSGSSGGFGTGSVGTSSTIPTIAPPDNTAARNAIYATAKDTAGKAGRASIDALRGELGATGMLGGGAEGQLVANAVENAYGETNQVTRDQAAKEADQSADFAKTGYAGAITQRGQDVAAREAEARLATERQLQESQQNFQQAQLKSQQQLQLLSMALGGLKSLGSY